MAELSTAGSSRRVLSSRVRAQLSYRASFWTDLVTAFAIGLLDFAEIYLVLHNVPVLGGLNLAQASLVFGLASLGFAGADLIFGQLDRIPNLVRLGQLEALLIRPMPLAAQLISSDVQLRRLGRVLLTLVILGVAVSRLGLDWSPATVYLLLVTPLVGTAIYGAIFLTAGGVQFFVIDGAEFTNSFTYGGSYAGQLPGAVLVTPIRLAFTFLVPATVTGYLPALLILGLPGPAFLPAWLGWWAPLFAIWSWLLATLVWRAGVRHYTGAGG